MTVLNETHGEITTYDLSPLVQESIEHWSSRFVNLQYLDLNNVFLMVAGNSPVVVFDQIVLADTGGGFAEAAVLDASPLFFAGSLPYTRSRILAGTPQYLKTIWLGHEPNIEMVCNQGGYHHGCFLFGGRFAVTTDQHLRLFERKRDTTRMVCEEKIRSGGVVKVFPIGTDMIGILYRNGMLDRYRINK